MLETLTPDTFAYTLILCGFLMVFAELFVTSFGLLGIGGLVMFTWGASRIFNDDIMLIVFAVDGAALLIMAVVGTVILRARNKPTISGVEGMVGQDAEVIDWAGHEGTVKIQGEFWQAKSLHGTTFTTGDTVTVSGNDDLVLTIRKD